MLREFLRIFISVSSCVNGAYSQLQASHRLRAGLQLGELGPQLCLELSLLLDFLPRLSDERPELADVRAQLVGLCVQVVEVCPDVGILQVDRV